MIEAVSTHIPLNPCSYNPNSNPKWHKTSLQCYARTVDFESDEPLHPSMVERNATSYEKDGMLTIDLPM